MSVGEEGGKLTEAVRRRPYAVILLDEIERLIPMYLTYFANFRGWKANGRTRPRSGL